MSRVVLLSSLVILAALPSTWAQQAQTASAPLPVSSSTVAARSSQVQPAPAVVPVQAAPSGPYYPPPDALQGPLTAADVCRSLRGGLLEAEVAQDVRERGMVGGFGDDEAADARAAGASAPFVAALQAGRFTVSAAYARRYADVATKRRQGAEANAWRAEAAAKAQAKEQEKESQRQSQLANAANQAAAAKELEDQRRFERMKDQAASEQRERDAYNANGGYWYQGVTLLREDASQRVYPLRELFDAVRWMVKAGCPWRLLPKRPAAVDSRAAASRTLEEGGLL